MTVRRAIEKYELEQELSRLHTAENASLERFMGRTAAMKRIADQLKQVAVTDFSVIIQGETGTGKTLLARILHNLSRRAGRKFVKVDLGSMPETIIEGELFGYEKGAFTGADKPREGFFEAAQGGTAFLDDLENISAQVQTKLLSVIESRETFRLGGRTPISLDVRFMAATNTDMQKTVQAGRFREDLFFRLGEFIITLPPLRERADDIPYFINTFLDAAVSELKTGPKSIDPVAIDRMLRHPWPGNLRELKNVVRRAALLSGDKEIGPEHVDFLLGSADRGDEIELMPLRQAVSDVERKLIRKTLAATKGNKARAAELLRIDIKTLRSKMAEHALE
jgi:DNA-binding NtrC family response regulator